MNRQGFTLVELSIVLVIIGLLIGGILVGQSLIELAKINRIISQVQQFDIAVSSFKGKYRGLPGDSVAFGCVNHGNGSVCGDGKITDMFASSQIWNWEIQNFWPNLQSGGFNYQGKTFTATIPSGGFKIDGQSINAPKIESNTTSGIIGAWCGTTSAINCWQIADWSGWNGSGYFWQGGRKTFTPVLAQAIDGKIDDGMATTGTVRNYMNYVDWTYGPPYSCSNYSPQYNLTEKDNVCYLSIGMFSQVGQVK